MGVYKSIKGKGCKCGAGAKSARCICPRDERYTFSFRFRGAQYTRKTDATVKAKAMEIERAFLKGLQGERCEEVLAFLKSDDSRMRRLCCSVGDVWAAYEAGWRQWMKNEKTARRNLTDLALVVAHALDMWTTNEGGRKGVKKGARVPDLARIRAVSVGQLNKVLVNRYFLSRQLAAGIATDEVPPMVWRREHEDHAAINSTLAKARDVFGKSAMDLAFGGLNLPDMREFLTASLLKEGRRLPAPFASEKFAGLCKVFDALRVAEPDLWLLNVISRQTGMRPGYVMSLQGSWLVAGDAGQWFISLKTRAEHDFELKEGTQDQMVPISLALRDLIAARGDGVVIAAGLSESARELLCKRHNLLIKTHLGEVGSHTQGAYRYRDTVASALAYLIGVEGAQWALGHTTSLTTLKHYTSALTGVGEAMRGELRAWLEEHARRRERGQNLLR